jgi:hypothetical protein
MPAIVEGPEGRKVILIVVAYLALIDKLFYFDQPQPALFGPALQPVARLLPTDSCRRPRPLREFAGKFRPLPPAEQDNLKLHDKDWCDPNA